MYKRFIILICFVSVLLSCRQETIISDEKEAVITQESEIAALIERVSLNDGSTDNIIDSANCFTIEFPYSVIINGDIVDIQNEDDYDDVEDILQESITNEIVINFPITIRNANQTTTIIATQTEFDALSGMCNGENVEDDDIECLDFVYPITFSIFNKVTEQISTITVQNDSQMYKVIEMLVFRATSSCQCVGSCESNILKGIISVFFAALAALWARFRTSSATTAKPAPASPALAASTAALRARRFV